MHYDVKEVLKEIWRVNMIYAMASRFHTLTVTPDAAKLPTLTFELHWISPSQSRTSSSEGGEAS